MHTIIDDEDGDVWKWLTHFFSFLFQENTWWCVYFLIRLETSIQWEHWDWILSHILTYTMKSSSRLLSRYHFKDRYLKTNIGDPFGFFFFPLHSNSPNDKPKLFPITNQIWKFILITLLLQIWADSISLSLQDYRNLDRIPVWSKFEIEKIRIYWLTI